MKMKRNIVILFSLAFFGKNKIKKKLNKIVLSLQWSQYSFLDDYLQ